MSCQGSSGITGPAQIVGDCCVQDDFYASPSCIIVLPTSGSGDPAQGL